MNLPKATELLQQDLDYPGSVDISDLNQAQELGIEALKQIQISRTRPVPYNIAPLPGETED